jgi:site-specific recombinase XerD
MHAMRATMATEMVRSGTPLSTVQDQLGHAAVSTTAIYVKKLLPEESLAPIATWEAWPS